MVAAMERPEERHFERTDRWLTDEIGAAFGLFPKTGALIITAIEHLYTAISTPVISGANLAQAALEGMIQSGDLVPVTELTIQVETGDRRHARRRNDGATHQQASFHDESSSAHVAA